MSVRLNVIGDVMLVIALLLCIMAIDHQDHRIDQLKAEKTMALQKVKEAEQLTNSHCWAQYSEQGWNVNCDKPVQPFGAASGGQ